jgi:hypothetical protein
MASSIPSLWADDIKVDALSPLPILRIQAGLLGEITHGLLEADVSTVSSGTLVSHLLDLIAPALDGYRSRILTATHSADTPYPVTVDAVCFKTPFGSEALNVSREKTFMPPGASSEQEFIRLVRQVLRSREIRSLIESLIVRSNEQRIADEGSLQDSKGAESEDPPPTEREDPLTPPDQGKADAT